MTLDSSDDEEWYDTVDSWEGDVCREPGESGTSFWEDDGSGVAGLDHSLPMLHGLRGDRPRGDLGRIVTEGAGPYEHRQSPGKWVTPTGEAGVSTSAPGSPLLRPRDHGSNTEGQTAYAEGPAQAPGRFPTRSRRRSADARQPSQPWHSHNQSFAAHHPDEGGIPPMSPYMDQAETDPYHAYGRQHHPSAQEVYDDGRGHPNLSTIYSGQPQYYEQALQDGYAEQQGVVWPSQQPPASNGSHGPAFEDEWDPSYGQPGPTHPTEADGGAQALSSQPLEASADRLSTLAEFQNLCASQRLQDEPQYPVQHHADQGLYEQQQQQHASRGGLASLDQHDYDPRSLPQTAHEMQQPWEQQQQQLAPDMVGVQPNGTVNQAEVAQRHHLRSSSEAAAAAASMERPSARPLHHYTQSLPSSFGDLSWPAHRAAFEGNVQGLLALLQGLSPEKQQELDPQGNSVLHLAVLRRNKPMVMALLETGFPNDLKNARRWEALDEAVALRDFELTRILLEQSHKAVKSLIKSKKGDLLQTLRSIDDVSFKVKWELGSSIVGPLLRRYGPHDTYSVWKRGTKVRVDGTLMGLDQKSSVPKFKRGHFSVLFDAAAQPASLVLADHGKGTFLNMTKERKQRKPDIDSEVRQQINEGAEKTKFRPSDFHFKPVRGWLGGDSTERIEGWKTRVYEATGKMVAVTISKVPIRLASNLTFDEYLQMVFEEDPFVEQQIDPLAMGGSKPGGHRASAAATGLNTDQAALAEKKVAAKQGGRKLSARCWMAEDFPMSLQQLSPILDIVGHANKHVARAAKFLHKYGEIGLFPVRLQVPIMYTVYLNSSFQKFGRLVPGSEALQDGFFDLPPGYHPKTMEEVIQKRQLRAQEAAEMDLQHGSESPLQLDLTEAEMRALES